MERIVTDKLESFSTILHLMYNAHASAPMFGDILAYKLVFVVDLLSLL